MSTHSKLMDELKALHDKKAADYANEKNRYANFERAAEIASWFSDPVDKVFATLIGVKLARTAELTQPGRVAQNESLDDSFVDLTNYAGIWTSYRRETVEEKGEEKANEHVLYPKGDGTCCVCGKNAMDVAGREKARCRPASQEYVYGVGSNV